MLESEIILYCAPTLAGLKTANMFSYKPFHMDHLYMEICQANSKLNEKGVFVEVLKTGKSRVLLYVYRKKKLKEDLKKREAGSLLKRCGYETEETEACIGHLKTRFSRCDCFPHEVGLFLGYPIHDVRGFIEQKGKNFKYTGIWKVYENEEETRAMFRKLKKCTRIYTRLFEEGISIGKLTVAA